MTTTELMNSKLKKPWLLIAAYDVSFDNYLSVEKKYRSYHTQFTNSPGGITFQMNDTLTNLVNQLKNISEHLRELDEQIHKYIRTHQE